jgi:hypothetical protein
MALGLLFANHMRDKKVYDEGFTYEVFTFEEF